MRRKSNMNPYRTDNFKVSIGYYAPEPNLAMVYNDKHTGCAYFFDISYDTVGYAKRKLSDMVKKKALLRRFKKLLWK